MFKRLFRAHAPLCCGFPGCYDGLEDRLSHCYEVSIWALS